MTTLAIYSGYRDSLMKCLTTFQELVHFFLDCGVPFDIEMSSLLFYWLEGCIYCQPVGSQTKGDAKHLFMAPSEDVAVLSKEFYQVLLDFEV